MAKLDTKERFFTGEAVMVRAKKFLSLVTLSVVLWPAVSAAASVQPLFDLTNPSRSPFPSDRFTVVDSTQNTGLRIALPKPDCVLLPSDCADVAGLNQLDGFNLTPRHSIPFDGSIDPTTVTSASVFLVRLGSTSSDSEGIGYVSGIDQVVWDPATQTLYVESDELLDQHTRYVLVVTKNLLDSDGKEIKPAKEFVIFTDSTITTSTGDPALDAYRTILRTALAELDGRRIIPKGQVVAASVFTTLSASANLEKIRDQIIAVTPEPVEFRLGPGGTRTVFARATLASFTSNQQVAPDLSVPLTPREFRQFAALIDVVAGAVGAVAFGRYASPDYRVHPGEFIPHVGTLSGTPIVQGTHEITFLLWIPSRPKPTDGYPVVIYGHAGTGFDKLSSAFVAAKLAEKGIATIAIDAPGVGFGPLSTYTIGFTNGTSMTFLSGGRSVDQNGDGKIDPEEGAGRDFDWQWAADHMQLVREVEVGIDLEGDGLRDLDPSRIYYLGSSRGARQGAVFLAVEPSVRAGVLNVVPGGDAVRLSAYRGGTGLYLQSRVPSLVNSPGISVLDGVSVTAPYFDENLPQRQGAPYSATSDGVTHNIQSPVVNTVAGAMDIQLVLERLEWADQSASAVAYASYLRRRPLRGVPPKSVIIQFPYGDRVLPNPATTMLLRAGDFADRATFFRADLVSVDPTKVFPGNPNAWPHAFLQIFTRSDPSLNATLNTIALQAEDQIASFFELDGPNHTLDPFDGSQIIDPDLDGPIFEVPIVLPLPQRLNYPLSPKDSATDDGRTSFVPGNESVRDSRNMQRRRTSEATVG